MKKLMLCVVVVMSVIMLCSQEYIQQPEIEMRERFDGNKTYVCEASNHITLKPGFQYVPINDHDMSISVNRYLIFPPVEDYYGSAYGVSCDADAVVGSLPATFHVNNMGAAIYSIDLRLPQAIGAMMPSLALVYNSQGGNGIMGWSWDLSGLSAITRVGQTEYHDGKVTSVDFVNDRFAVDGQRLIALDNAVYGANKTVYKTEIDNMDKIISYTDGYNGPKYFEIWKSDGMIWEYGNSHDSRMEPQSLDRKVFKWLLNRISDRDGNAICFHYDINNKTGESYINNIEYTLNERNGVEAAYRIVFEYEEERLDAWSGYVAGVPVLCSRLLKNISVLKNDTKKVLFDYSLEYDNPGYYGKKYFLHYRLNSVGLKVGDEKINSTRIVWNSEKKHYPQPKDFRVYEIDKTMFTEVPFVGDFNGDGLSDVLTVPYKIQNTYSGNVNGKVFLNNGDGTFMDEPMTTITLSKNLDWIYVVDMNDDGKDDFVAYEYNYGYKGGDDVLATLNFYLQQNGSFIKKVSYSYDNNISIIPGNFVSNDKRGIVVFANNDNISKRYADYIACENNSFFKTQISNTGSLKESGLSYMAADITGDGIVELISLGLGRSYIHKLVCVGANSYSLQHYTDVSVLNKDMYLFPNDFNGDAKTDILYYDTRTRWNIILSKGNGFASPMSCVNTNLLRNVTLNPKDRYVCSLKQITEPTIAIRTADFDGDGLSDVAVFHNHGGNYYLQVGFLPHKTDDTECDFVHMERYYCPINYSHQNLHIGRFLPQENISFVSSLSRKPYETEKPYMVSVNSHSAKYSVERIIDGMGNTRGFSYDYLMPKKGSDFYTSDNGKVGYMMRRTSLPLRALKSDTIYNTNNKPVVTTYEYNNAVVHTKGHGFLAFEKTTTRTIINKECVSKQVQDTEFGTMGSSCISLPSSMKIYQGENQLMKEVIPMYRKYHCKSNPKVVLPLLVDNVEIEYDCDKSGRVLRKVIAKYEYRSDNASDNSYDKIIQLTGNTVGYSDDASSRTIDDCQYTEERYAEFNNDMDDWVISRPALKKAVFSSGDGNKIGSVEIYRYESDNPLKVSAITKVPNVHGDDADSLTVNVDYQYDKFGHMTMQTMTSLSMKHDKTLRYEYAETYQYRYLTKTIDEHGNEITCEYDDDYGYLTRTTDYNQFVTINTKDPLAIDDMVQLPDGMRQIRSLRWASGNEYAPGSAMYYCWSKSSGNAEKMVFYHKDGSELRTVTFDINGNEVFQDKYYDDLGNVVQETLPYYRNDNKIMAKKKYDKYNRLVRMESPNGMICELAYDGNEITEKYLSREGMEKVSTDTYNVKGWLVNAIDVGGNNIAYEYYSDGLLKSSKINNNENTKVEIGYDNNRNRNYMYDPNYGSVRYTNDALGNIVRIVTSKGNVVEFEYDESGRKICRKEYDKVADNDVVTHWIYESQKGKIGTLKKVYNDSHSIEYCYDDKLRVANMIETIDEVGYKTEYTYDKANRISTITYPTGLTLLKTYSASGFEQMCQDKDSETLLWKTIKTNACGGITEFQLGNGVKTLTSYDPYTSMIDNIYTVKDDMVIQDLSYEYDTYGNMMSRSKRVGTYVREAFEYDRYDRLTAVSLNGDVVENLSYDDVGNIVKKEAEGKKVLYDVMYDGKKPYRLLEARTQLPDLFQGAKQEIGYSASDNVEKVTYDDKRLSIDYGCEQRRIFMSFDDGESSCSKTYVGNNEFVDRDGVKTCHTYLVGPMGVFGVYNVDDEGNKSISYIHKDNLDSWNVITDENGDVVQEFSFDAWGNMREPDKWLGEPTNDRLLLDRGFTGHEHLNDFGLINMNGRLYDPIMSRMVSPDNNIQMPQMSQNYNRYSYCLNNPLKYNDPTGEWVESVLLGVACGASNVVLNADEIDTFAEGLMLFGVGFAQGFLAEYTMGQSWFVQVGANALMGGLKNGVNELVSVGDGSFNLSGDDWNAVTHAAYYGLGKGLVKGVFNSYIHAPTDEDRGFKLHFLFFDNEEVAHTVTSLMAHGVGCWFSGRPLLEGIGLSDFGLDLEMLNIVANRLLSSYIYKSDFADKVIEQRAREIKDRMMKDILSENPEHGDFKVFSELRFVDVYAGRVYVSGDVFAILPGEIFEILTDPWITAFPKPYLNEVVSFPFSYSLFRTIFFDK